MCINNLHISGIKCSRLSEKHSMSLGVPKHFTCTSTEIQINNWYYSKRLHLGIWFCQTTVYYAFSYVFS